MTGQRGREDDMRRYVTGALVMAFLCALVVPPLAEAARRTAVIQVKGMTCDG